MRWDRRTGISLGIIFGCVVVGTWCSRALSGMQLFDTARDDNNNKLLWPELCGLEISGTVVQGISLSACIVCILSVLICYICTTTSDLNSIIRYGPNHSKDCGQYNQTSWPFVKAIALTLAPKSDFSVFADCFVALYTRSWAAHISIYSFHHKVATECNIKS